uniref:Serine hydrolase FSH domain-containing protein n=1 Tax=viral metagenome TaxID=1070528 RepID=A0A6C0JAC9_9ZZZZ
MNIDYLIYYPVNGTSSIPLRTISFDLGTKLNYIGNIDSLNPGITKAVIYYHGNATSSDSINSLISNLYPKYIIPEYPGYKGAFPCKNNLTVTETILEGVNTLAQWLYKHKIKVHIIGQSIGSGPACKLASSLPKKLLLSLQLITPFININDLINDYTLFGGYLISDYYYNNLEELRKIISYCPINIYHGNFDTIINIKHSTQIQNQLKNNINLKMYITNTNHNDILTPYVLKIIKNFLD